MTAVPKPIIVNTILGFLSSSDDSSSEDEYINILNVLLINNSKTNMYSFFYRRSGRKL